MPNITEIVPMILERTKEGRLDWAITANVNSFLATLGNQSLKITRTPETLYENEGYSLVVLNKDGVEIDQTSASIRSTEGKQLANIFGLARRRALNVEEELDELVKMLSSR